MELHEAEELRRRLVDMQQTPHPTDEWAEDARLNINDVALEAAPTGDWRVAVRFGQAEYRHLYRRRHLRAEAANPIAEAVADIWDEVICEPHGDLRVPKDRDGYFVWGDDL